MSETHVLKLGIDARGARTGASAFGVAAGGIKRSAGALVHALNPLHMSLAKLATYASLGSLAYGVQNAVRSYATFEKQLANVSTMLDKTTMHYLPKYEKQLRSLSKTYGESTETLSLGTYDLLSASVDASKAMGVLEIATQAAIAGMTDTKVAGKVITDILDSYGMGIEQASRVSDILFATVKRGKTTFPELASSIGQVAAAASVAGLSIEEVGAAIATMTRAGLDTSVAVMSLKNIITTFLQPTDDSKAVAKELGIELSSATLRAEGLTGALNKLGGASAEQLAALMPNVRGFVGFAASLKQASKQTGDLEFIMNSAGARLEAFGKMSATADFKFSQLKQSLADAKRIIGKAFIDDAVTGVKSLTAWLDVNETKIRYWSSVASIEFTKLRKDVVAFAEYLQKDFSGAMDVAFDTLISGMWDASRIAISLALSTGSAMWEAFKSGVLKTNGYSEDELFTKTNEKYIAAGGTRSKAPGSDRMFYTGPQLVEDDQVKWDRLEQEARTELQGRKLESLHAGFAEDAKRIWEQNKARRQRILADAAGSEAGKGFVGELNANELEADAQKGIAVWKQYFSEIQQAAQPYLDVFAQVYKAHKALFGFGEGVPANGVAAIAPKKSIKPLSDNEKEMQSMRDALEQERSMLGLTNDEREKAIALAKFQTIAEAEYGDATDTSIAVIQQYRKELEALAEANKKVQAVEGQGKLDEYVTALKQESRMLKMATVDKQIYMGITEAKMIAESHGIKLSEQAKEKIKDEIVLYARLTTEKERAEKKSGAQASVNQAMTALDREYQLIGKTVDERERAITMTELQSQAMIAYAGDQERVNTLLGEFNEKLDAIDKQRKLVKIADDIGDAFGRTFERMIFDMQSVGDAVRSLTEDIARLIFQQMIAQPIASGISNWMVGKWGSTGQPAGDQLLHYQPYGSAKGNAFNDGRLLAFARGGIVDGPTLFPMRRGAGLMGEAGPEAVMPLRRTRNGNLGVEASGAGGTTQVVNEITIINQSSQPVSAKIGSTERRLDKYVTQIILTDAKNFGPLKQAGVIN